MKYTRCLITSDNETFISQLKQRPIDRIMSDISDYIIEVNDKKIIKKYIRKNKLGKEAEDFFEKGIDKHFKRKKYLITRISEYLVDNKNINIDGFIKFRLNDYNSHLEEVLKQVEYDYCVHTDYEVFIEILREIIRNQHQMVKVLNIEIADGGYYIYDENNTFLNNKCISILNEEFDYIFDYRDDFLFSAVITLAPEKIIIKNPERIVNRKLFETINKIYEKI